MQAEELINRLLGTARGSDFVNDLRLLVIPRRTKNSEIIDMTPELVGVSRRLPKG